MGACPSICCQTQADASFASVQEQSGLFAGAGGFDIEVQGTTKLTGGAIASDTDTNQLTTGDLQIDSIANSEAFNIESQSLSLGTGSNPGGGDTTDSGSQSSTTQSVLAEGTIQVTNNPDINTILIKNII